MTPLKHQISLKLCYGIEQGILEVVLSALPFFSCLFCLIPYQCALKLDLEIWPGINVRYPLIPRLLLNHPLLKMGNLQLEIFMGNMCNQHWVTTSSCNTLHSDCLTDSRSNCLYTCFASDNTLTWVEASSGPISICYSQCAPPKQLTPCFAGPHPNFVLCLHQSRGLMFSTGCFIRYESCEHNTLQMSELIMLQTGTNSSQSRARNGQLRVRIIIIIIIPKQCLWCCHHGRTIARVHPVHLMNVDRRQAAADPRPNHMT